MRSKVVIGVCAIALLGGWWLFSDSESEANATDSGVTVTERIWISKIPQTERDKFDILILTEEQGNFGAFLKTSQFEGEYSYFQWTQKGANKFKILLLQEDKHYELSAKTSSKCSGFDYCLEVKGAPRGAKKYVSQKDWVLTDGDIRGALARAMTLVE